QRRGPVPGDIEPGGRRVAWRRRLREKSGARGRCRHNRSRQRAAHGVGFHPEVSACFLKWLLVQYGCARYVGSTGSVDTARSESPPGTSKRSKYSVTTASPLYGTPFLRRYPDFIFVVTTLSEPPRAPPPGKNPAPKGGVDRSQLAAETPCQSPPWP